MGGGVMRTAVKAAATGAFRSPLIDEVSRRAARQQVSSFVPAAEPGLGVPILSAGPARTEAPALTVAPHWPDWEFDDWELAGVNEESLESVDVTPRLVFGPVPTLEEAKEATTDLKDALEKVYFTTHHTLDPHEGSQATASGESGTVSAAPKHVAQMFSLLQESSEAQDVVASLASDKNVWEAVMKNEKVLAFCNNPSPALAQIYRDPAESVAENKSPDDLLPTVEMEETTKSSRGRVLLNGIKVKVSQMANKISDFIQDFFGNSPRDCSSSGEQAASSTANNYPKIAFGVVTASAVATILVILLKRR